MSRAKGASNWMMRRKPWGTAGSGGIKRARAGAYTADGGRGVHRRPVDEVVCCAGVGVREPSVCGVHREPGGVGCGGAARVARLWVMLEGAARLRVMLVGDEA